MRWLRPGLGAFWPMQAAAYYGDSAWLQKGVVNIRNSYRHDPWNYYMSSSIGEDDIEVSGLTLLFSPTSIGLDIGTKIR